MVSSNVQASLEPTPAAVERPPAPPPLEAPPGGAAGRPWRERWLEFRRQGVPAIWFTGVMTLVILMMLVGMIVLVLRNGFRHFWPAHVVQVTTESGRFLGPIVETDVQQADSPNEPSRERWLVKIGNRDLHGLDFRWFDASAVQQRSEPRDATIVERREHGNFHGYLQRIRNGENIVAEGPAAWTALGPQVREAQAKARQLRGVDSSLDEYSRLAAELAQRVAVFTIADGREKEIPLETVVRAYRPNAMGPLQRVGFYLGKLREFLFDPPRESNTEGGIFPALFGTVLMVLLMTLAVVPLGVMAALYLHEYATKGPVLRAVRLAVSNLAGVPSIVFGMFGLAFFVYGVGGFIDRTFFPGRLPNPTFGTGGLLWASLTLALLTLPVVIVATEEGLAAVPRANREGSLALGATQWQTLWHVVLPNALPGILTGLILAVSRGAGEVAPLMLTGVVKLAPDLAVDGSMPFLHLDRKFMHLGFHIYDVSMQSPNVEAAKPMVYATTLLLLVLVAGLNASAIVVRNRMRHRYRGAAL
jgi:phosphate transport system permease protein